MLEPKKTTNTNKKKAVVLLLSLLFITAIVTPFASAGNYWSLDKWNLDLSGNDKTITAISNYTASLSWAGVVPYNATGTHNYYFQFIESWQAQNGIGIIVTLRNTTNNDVALQTITSGSGTTQLYSHAGANVTRCALSYDGTRFIFTENGVKTWQSGLTSINPMGAIHMITTDQDYSVGYGAFKGNWILTVGNYGSLSIALDTASITDLITSMMPLIFAIVTIMLVVGVVKIIPKMLSQINIGY